MLHQKELSILERLKAHDITTYNHSMHVAELSREFAKYLVNQTTVPDKQAFIDRVYNAASVHDAGKLTIPSEVINKPGNLTDAERDLMVSHSEAALEVLTGFPEDDIQVALEHHMNYQTDSMCLESQIVAVCDVFSAITLERSYSPAHTASFALSDMTTKKCDHLNPELLQFLDHYIKEYSPYYENGIEKGLPKDYKPKEYEDYIQQTMWYLSSKYHLSSNFLFLDHYNGHDFIVYHDTSAESRKVIGVLHEDGTIWKEPHEIEMLNNERLFSRSIEWSKFEDPQIPDVDEYEEFNNDK